ncbi:MAG: COG3650 family protein [Maritimibacter harenae]
MRALVLILCLLTGPAAAQELPALYDVRGVAQNDTLNVRSRPTVEGRILGELGPNARGVEVVQFNTAESWGQVNVNGQAGWVSMAYMARQPGQPEGEKLPTPINCYGTEPFWSLDITEQTVTFTDQGMDAAPMTMQRQRVAQASWSPRGALAAQGITGFLSREMCTDGMSDQNFGWRIDFLLSGNGGHFSFSGCCSLER